MFRCSGERRSTRSRRHGRDGEPWRGASGAGLSARRSGREPARGDGGEGGGSGREAELGLDGFAAALGERDLVLGGAAAEARQRPRDDGDLAEGLVDGEADDDHGREEAPRDDDEDPEGEVRLREDAGRRRQGGPEDDEDEGGAPADALDPVQRGHELLLA